MSGLQIARAARAVPASTDGSAGGTAGAAASESVGPDADHLRAQERFLKEGKKLSDPEKFKRELHPFDGYARLKAQAANNEPPKADDNFRWRFYGLFYCAPNQTAYMCRLRIPNGILKHWQFAGVGELAERYAAGYSHVTTRANLQLREVEPKNAVALIEAIQDCVRADRAPTTSAMSPGRRPPASIRRSSSTRGPMLANGTSTSLTTARSTAFHGSSTSASTAPVSFRCSKTPTTSAFRRSK